jgi:hypothetical protein
MTFVAKYAGQCPTCSKNPGYVGRAISDRGLWVQCWTCYGSGYVAIDERGVFYPAEAPAKSGQTTVLKKGKP